MYYQFNPQYLADKTAEAQANLADNQPNADFVEFAAGVIYQRLKKNIRHYRQYGVYWWALKDVLRRQDYNVGDETDKSIERIYRGADDAQTIVAADMFYEDMAGKVTADNMDWQLSDTEEYRLWDEDMELRLSVTDMIHKY